MNAAPIELSPETINAVVEAVARRVVELQSGAVTSTSDILTVAEARVYVKRFSPDAFYDWCKKWDVKAKSYGRYSRAKLDLALEREAGTAHTPAAIKRKQQALAIEPVRCALP